MKLEEIQQQWQTDSKIDRTELGEESLRVSHLHSKYFNLFSTERLRLKSLENDYKKYFKVKFEYYSGILTEEELKNFGWEPFQLKILKSDLNIYLDGDSDLAKIRLTIETQKEKVEFLESIIKNLPSRGYQIKSAIDWEKFKVGV